MSPSLPANHRGWFWSLPAFAVIVSLLWYRKKRGSLKTDSGGVVEETRDDQTSVNCEEEEEEKSEEISPDKSTLMISDILKVNGDKNQVEVFETVNQVSETKLELSSRSVETTEEFTVEAEKIEFFDRKPEIQEEGRKKKRKKKKKKQQQQQQQQQKKNQQEEEEDEVKTVIRNVSKSKCQGKSMEMAKKSLENSKKKEGGGSTACILEKKLAQLDLTGKNRNDDGVEEKPMNEDVAERDSANNSPSEVMLASPSVSGYSDTHSEGSSDSGKGCSEMLTPSRTPASGNSVSGDAPATLVYEFEIPQYLVGRLIGRHGNNAYEIKRTTNATIYIKTHPNTEKLKICAIEGTQMDVDSALEMIRRKFSKKRFPNLTLEQVVISPEPLMVPIYPEYYQLYLIEGINNDVILSSLVSAGHFFLQQPTHPTFPALVRLNAYMAHCYSQPNQPSIPEGVGAGVLCAAPVHDGWYRAQITEMEEGSEFCSVKFVDYGGYMSLPVSTLRQIRADFINLPFQAAECYLADVKPANGEVMWSEEAKETVEKLTFGNILQAQVYGYAFPGVPLIYLYTVVNNEFILINEELVNRGYAEWQYSESPEEVQQQQQGGEQEIEQKGVAESHSDMGEVEPVAVPV